VYILLIDKKPSFRRVFLIDADYKNLNSLALDGDFFYNRFAGMN
jgi:hypothetical protein